MNKGLKNMPLVTVLLPAYNAVPHLQEAIESILEQSFTDYEFLIINDGSTDGSEDIILNFQDDRILYVKNHANLGLVETLNRGIELARGKYIARMDADDRSLPERLSKQVAFMEENPNVAVCGTWFDQMISGKIKLGGRYKSNNAEIKQKHLYQIQICHGSTIIRTEILINHNLRYSTDFIHAEDYDLFDRIGIISEIRNIPEVLYLVRIHENRVSTNFQKVQVENSFRVRKRIFGRLNLNVCQRDMELYTDLMHQNYERLKQHSESVLELLNSMYLGNLSTGEFDRVLFKKHIHNTWLHFNLNVISRMSFDQRLYYRLRLSSHFRLGLKNRLKLIIRAITR